MNEQCLLFSMNSESHRGNKPSVSAIPVQQQGLEQNEKGINGVHREDMGRCEKAVEEEAAALGSWW